MTRLRSKHRYNEKSIATAEHLLGGICERANTRGASKIDAMQKHTRFVKYNSFFNPDPGITS